MSKPPPASPSLSLTIPEPEGQSIVPAGWAVDIIAPLLQDADWEAVDNAEARIKILASWYESHAADGVEFEKALRVVEYRRGVLAGEPVKGKPNVGRIRHYEGESKDTLSVWRKIASHWPLIWPLILEAKTAAEVTQAAILRLIARQTPPTNGHKPPEPRKAQRSSRGGESAQEIADALSRRTQPPPVESHEPDIMEEFQATAKENERLRALVESLQADDTGRELAKMSEKYARLEGRLRQCMTTEAEAIKDAKYAKGQLAKVRKALGVESDREIHKAIADMRR